MKHLLLVMGKSTMLGNSTDLLTLVAPTLDLVSICVSLELSCKRDYPTFHNMNLLFGTLLVVT